MLEDHDLAAETAMLAFGGKPFACLGVLKRWRDMHTWAMSVELYQQMQARLGPDVVLLPGDLKAVHELGLMLTWERTWRRLSFYGEYERLLSEQVGSRALAPLREHLAFWRRRSGSRLISAPEVRVLRPGQTPSLTGWMDKVRGSATAALGVSWVHRVWGRGLALVDGAFVLDVEDAAPAGSGLRIRAVRWEEREGGTWVPVARMALTGVDAEGTRWLAWEDQ